MVRPNQIRFVPRLLVLAACALAGCAETSLTPEGVQPLPMLATPDRIIVHDFAVTAAQISREAAVGATEVLNEEDPDDAPLDEKEKHIEKARKDLGEATASELSDALVKHLKELGLPAERAGVDDPEPTPGADEVVLGIHGQFVRIEEGDAVRRIVVGFGVGHSQIDCEVQVHARVSDGTIRFSEFAVSARSGHRPGLLETLPVGMAIIGPGVAAIAAGGATAGTDVKATTEADAKRAAEIITKYLGSRFYREGWINAEMAKKAGVQIKGN